MKQRQGSALVLALIVVLIVGMMATSFMHLNASATSRQALSVDNKLSFYLAEAGLAEGFASLVAGRSGVVGSKDSPARFGDGVVWVAPTQLDARHIQLEAYGTCGRGSAYLSMVARQGHVDAAQLGIYTNQDLSLPVGTFVDGYDSTEESEAGRSGGWSGAPVAGEEDPPGVMAKLGSNGSISVSSSERSPTTVIGNLTYGPKGNADLIGRPIVRGSVTQSNAVFAFPAIEFPVVERGSDLEHRNGMPFMVDAGAHSFGRITVGSESTLVLTGPLSLVADSITAEAMSTLVVDERAGAVEIYVRETMRLAPRSTFEQLGSDPLGLRVQIDGDGTSELSADGALYGFVYAPNGTVQLGNTLECHGSLVADGLAIAAGASLHYDAALAKRASSASLPKVVSWRIVRIAEFAGAAAADGFAFDRTGQPALGEATENPSIEIECVDRSGDPLDYTGEWNDFSWAEVAKVSVLVKDGVPFTDAEITRLNQSLEERYLHSLEAAEEVAEKVPLETIDPTELNLAD
ncbi:MAG: hypothetical protein WD226_02230 [Planctomycetota bacterium]